MLWLFWGQGLSIEWIPIFKAHIFKQSSLFNVSLGSENQFYINLNFNITYLIF